MKHYVFSTLLFCAMVLCGCESNKKLDMGYRGTIPSTAIGNTVAEQTPILNKIQKNTEDIGVQNVAISNETNKIDQITDTLATQEPANQPAVEAIQTSTKAIIDSTEIIHAKVDDTIEQLKTAKEKVVALQQLVKPVQALENENAKLKSEQERLKNDAIHNLYSTLGIAFGFCLISIVAGIALAFTVNKRLGIAFIGLGIIGCALVAGSVFYLKTIAVVGLYSVLGCVLTGISLGIYYLIRTSKQAQVLEQANVENVQLVQQIKDHLDDTVKAKIFGAKPEIPLVDQIQSDKTKEIVQKIKEKL